MLLKCHSSLPGGPRRARCGGWTLAEMIVAVAAGTVILLAFVSAFVTLSNTMVAINNYNDLDSSSRHALDQMGEDLRDTATVLAFANNSITVTNALTGDQIKYWWDSQSSCFNRQVNSTTPTVLLTNCDILTFAGYMRVPTNNFSFITNDGPSTIKLISVSWRCSRTVLGLKLNTESVQTARICIRN